jgi:hypothetical protein
LTYISPFPIIAIIAADSNLGANLAKEVKASARIQEQQEIGNLERRMDMLDRRLDDIDSMVSAVIERVMSQPISIDVTCPHCGKNIEIGLIGNKKARA